MTGTDRQVSSPRRRRQIIALTLVSLVSSIGILEVVLRVLVEETRFLDTSSEAFWAARMHAEMHRTASAGAEKDTVHDPALGWRMKPLYEAEGVHHDARGFRRTDRTTGIERAGDRTVFVVGDSFTYGLGVSDHETYSAQLAELTGADVVNAGVNAYGFDQALLMWEHEGRPLRPDVVVVGFFVDDFHRSALTLRDGPKPFFEATGEGFELAGVPVPDIHDERWAQRVETRAGSRVLDLSAWTWRRVESKLGWVDEAALAPSARLNRHLLGRFRDSAAEVGAGLLVVVIGPGHDGIPTSLWIEASMVEACRAAGVHYVNMAEVMREYPPHSFYGSNGHWSSRGHRFAAERISDVLEK